MVARTFNLNTHETPGLWVLGQTDLDSEFQDSYSETLSQNKKQGVN